MNPAETDALKALVRRIRDAGTTVLLVEHDMGFVMDLSDRITVLNFGRRIFEGTPIEVRQETTVIEAYLGHEVAEPPRGGQPRHEQPAGSGPQRLLWPHRSAARHRPDRRHRPGGLPDRGQRRGQDHDHARAVRPGAPACRAGAPGRGGHPGLRPHRIAAAGLLQVPEGRQVFAELTVAENLAVGAWLVSDRAEIARRQEAVLARFPRLRERLDQLAGSMSGGEQQMLALGRALMGAPKLLLLDEPSMGLSPIMVDKIFAGGARGPPARA